MPDQPIDSVDTKKDVNLGDMPLSGLKTPTTNVQGKGGDK